MAAFSRHSRSLSTTLSTIGKYGEIFLTRNLCPKQYCLISQETINVISAYFVSKNLVHQQYILNR
jgi:hypothetical protein